MKASWRTVRIGDVCDLATGGTPSSSKPEYYEGGDVPWLVSGDIHRGQIHDCEGRITRLGLENSNARWLPVDSVIIALNGQGKTRGTVALLRMNATCNQSLVSINPRNTRELMPEFLFWNLHGRYEEIRRITGDDGNERRGLNMPLIRNISFPLPPIEEQRRIVAVLNEAFAAIATATTNAGKNLANARELFDASLRGVLGNAEGQWTSLGKATDIKVGFAFKSSGYSAYEEDVPLIRGDNVVQGRLRWDDVKRWPQSDVAQYEAYRLEAGDVLLAMDRTWVKAGLKYAVLGSTDIPSLLVQRVARLRAKDFTSSKFIALQIAAPAFTEYVLGIQTGLGVPHISGKQIADYCFRMPELAQQSEMIEKLSKAEQTSARLIAIYTEKLRGLERLKQSLLRRAFSGEPLGEQLLAA